MDSHSFSVVQRIFERIAKKGGRAKKYGSAGEDGLLARLTGRKSATLFDSMLRNDARQHDCRGSETLGRDGCGKLPQAAHLGLDLSQQSIPFVRWVPTFQHPAKHPVGIIAVPQV